MPAARNSATRTPGLRILGIDPALTVTGYGVIVVEGSTSRALEFGCVAPDKKLPKAERLNRIYGAISQVITEYEPDEVAVEDFIVGHIRAAVAVGEARAVAMLAAARRTCQSRSTSLPRSSSSSLLTVAARKTRWH